MGKKTKLTERGTGDVLYPVTHQKCIVTDDNSGVATKQYADEAAAQILNSSPEQLSVINSLATQLADDANLANVVTNTIAQQEKKEFIEKWNRAGIIESELNPRQVIAYYDEENDEFDLEGIKLTYEQAKWHYEVSFTRKAISGQDTYAKCCSHSDIKAMFPQRFEENAKMYHTFAHMRAMKIVRVSYGDPTKEDVTNLDMAWPSDVRQPFYLTDIKEVRGIINCNRLNSSSLQNDWGLRTGTREIYLYGVKANAQCLTNCQSLSLASISFLVKWASNTTPITITVHADVYAKLTGDTTNEAVAALTTEELAQWAEVLTNAAAKNISFATV